jgi:hypothetical protein
MQPHGENNIMAQASTDCRNVPGTHSINNCHVRVSTGQLDKLNIIVCLVPPITQLVP